MPEPADDALQRLRDQVKAAQETAQRVAEEAAKAATTTPPKRDVPPAGYAVPGSGEAGAQNPEVQAIVALIEIIRGLIPPDLQQQLAELVKELLALVRAVIDLIVSRLERERPAEAEVEDIPIG
jgi:hypothetical protein